MRILDRYILRSFFGALFVSVIAMVGLYLLVHFFTHVRYLSQAEVAFDQVDISLFSGVCTYYMLHIPEMIVMFGPYTIMMAAMFTIHSLNQNNELIPMFALGATRLRVAAPIFLLAGALSLGLLAVKEGVVPGLAADMVRYHRMLKGDLENLQGDIPPIRDGRGNVFVFSEWDREALSLSAVRVYSDDRIQPAVYERLTWSPHESGGSWMGEPVPGVDLNSITDLEPPDIDTGPRSRARMAFRDLRRLAKKRPERLDLAAIMHGHLSYPFSPIILLLLGLPLVMRARTKSVFVGLGIAVILSLLYFSASQILLRLGAQGDFVSPTLGAWLPVVGFGSLGLLLFESQDR